jgi:aldehyde:ferredoxin oxidoreductase
MGGYKNRILEVDLSIGRMDVSDVSEDDKKRFIGGSGVSENPTFLLIEDSRCELRDASDLWGKDARDDRSPGGQGVGPYCFAFLIDTGCSAKARGSRPYVR